MPICPHCHKSFRKGNDRGSLKRHLNAVKAIDTRKSVTSKTRKKNPKQKTKKGSSKESLPPGVYHCKWIKKNGKPCNKLELTSNRKKHNNQHKGAKKASAKNIDSERQYEEKLRRENPGSLVFQTGTEGGVPDIVMYKNEKLSFYEIKPTGKGNDSLLKVDQAKWIKKNCFHNKIDAYLVRYKGRTKKFTFVKKKLGKKNIGMYEP